MADEHDQHDHDDPVADVPQLDQARREIAEAVGRYADGWSSTEGAVVTTIAVVAEVACPDGELRLLPIYANGAGDVEIAPWRAEGLLSHALKDL